MAMGSSPMVPQKAEQSQLLVQQPDAPSPAQPQVLNVKYKFLTVTCFFFHPYKICFKLGLKMITSKSSKLSLLYITSLVLVNRKLGIFLLCRDDSGVCWLKWNCDSYFPFLVFFSTHLVCLCVSFWPLPCFSLQVSPAQPTGGRRRRTTDDDPDERRQRFLERNRAAASRCRQKRKLWVSSLEKKAEELSTLNVSLSVSGPPVGGCWWWGF